MGKAIKPPHSELTGETMWTNLLKSDIDANYRTTAGLIDVVDEGWLDWKPATGDNWMTVGQLLRHLTHACGSGMKGFVTGDWGLPPGMTFSDIPPEEMMPKAEKLPSVSGLAEAKAMLEADRRLAVEMVERAGEERLATQIAVAPWDNKEMLLGQYLLHMVTHLQQHKGQLFYYLKLQGAGVHTGHLWGM